MHWSSLMRTPFVRGLAGSSQMTAIKKLRDVSGAPLGDVKAALEETQYDLGLPPQTQIFEVPDDVDLAYDALRRKGLAAAAKKDARSAKEGLIGIAAADQSAAIVEVNCETDFVARNAIFCSFVRRVADTVLVASSTHAGGVMDLEKVKTLEMEDGTTIGASAVALTASIREKIAIRRIFRSDTSGRLFSYCHNAPPGDVSGLGKIASLVTLEDIEGRPLNDDVSEALDRSAFGQHLAMHVAASRPFYLNIASVDSNHLLKERELLRRQALDSGKPSNIVDRIVEGRLKKFYEAVCLLQQGYVMDDDATVEAALRKFAKEHRLSQKIKIGSFLRVQCGEGLQDEEETSL